MAGAHGHDHDHGAMPASPEVKKILTWVMVPLVVLTVVAMLLLWPDRPEPPEEDGRGTYYAATVVSVTEVECAPAEAEYGRRACGEVTVRVNEGPDAGQSVVTDMPDGPGAPRVSAGDEVLLFVGFDPADPEVRRYDIADHQRGLPLLLLAGLFALAIVAFGRLRGVASLAGLAACFTLLITFVLPAIIDGQPPLLVAVVGAAMVMFVIMYLVHGVSVRTTVAVLGTLGALVVTGLLGVLATAATHLTGFVSDEARLLWSADPGLDLRGVLLAGIIIGSLGVLDDVTVSQSATVGEIARVDPRMSRRQLYLAGARVGRAHIASVVNTLVLAYAGASLPLLILIVLSTGGQNAGDVVTTEAIAQEIVRSAVATVGLIAAVPLTTGLAALVCGSATQRGGSPPGPASSPVPPGSAGPTSPPGPSSPSGPTSPSGPPDSGRPGATGVATVSPPPAGESRPPRHRRVDPGEALGAGRDSWNDPGRDAWNDDWR